LTVPNILTLVRILLVIPFCYFVTAGIQWDSLAMVIFVVAAFTDWFDGFYARRFKQFSDAGKLLDPLADKLLVATALVAFVADNTIRLPVWGVVVILGREFLITGFRGMLASRQVVMAADQLGKAKTVSQMAAIIILLVARDPGGVERTAFVNIGIAVFYISVMLTILSGVSYLWTYRAYLLESFKANPAVPGQKS
jgi:CDP-diacylglycerol---glycerol-3-phosphate 3-phosphatidyltransferase